MRRAFELQEKISWYPRHMMNSFKQMQAKLRAMDFLIEVHDARIPFSGRNPNLKNLLGIKPRILVLNKKDLISMSHQADIRRQIQSEDDGIIDVLYTNAKNLQDMTLKKIIPTVINYFKANDRYNREDCKDFNLMIMGVPNVGKSSLLNAFRHIYLHKKSATPEGPYAGVTRSVLNKILVYPSPKIFVIDTPGIMAPKIPDLETAMRLALCSTFRDDVVGLRNIADYLLFWLNKSADLDKQEYFRHKPKYYMDNRTLHLPIDSNTIDQLTQLKNGQNYNYREIEKAYKSKFLDNKKKDHLVNNNYDDDTLLNFEPYLDMLTETGPTDDIISWLIRLAFANGFFIKCPISPSTNNTISSLGTSHRNHSDSETKPKFYEYKPDIESAATLFVSAFRSGNLGKYILDYDKLRPVVSNQDILVKDVIK